MNELTKIESSILAECEVVIERGLSSFIDVGNALLKIRDGNLYKADFATFEDYCRERWGMQRAHAYRLMDSAEVVKNLSPIGDIIPVNEAQARHLAQLDPEEQVEAWQKVLDLAPDGKVTEKLVKKVVDEYKEPVETPDLPAGKYRVFYADPPWKYTSGDQHGTEEQDTVLGTHYPSMTISELCALPIKEMTADNAVMFMWVTSPLLDECFEVIKAWGFEYKTSIVWDKMAHNVGHYVSVRHEFLLICTRGSCKPDIDKLLPSVVSEKRTEHSAKPETFRTMIDTMYPNGNRIELFARHPADGWEVWGNEVA